MRLLSAGPCCEIKGHSHWMSNPCSDLFSPWPMGKSSAIRAVGASFIIAVIIVRIIAGATERRLASPFNSSHVSNISTSVDVSGNIGSCRGIVRGGKQLARPEKGGDSKAACIHLENKGEGGGASWRAKWVINCNNGSDTMDRRWRALT